MEGLVGAKFGDAEDIGERPAKAHEGRWNVESDGDDHDCAGLPTKSRGECCGVTCALATEVLGAGFEGGFAKLAAADGLRLK